MPQSTADRGAAQKSAAGDTDKSSTEITNTNEDITDTVVAKPEETENTAEAEDESAADLPAKQEDTETDHKETAAEDSAGAGALPPFFPPSRCWG